MLKILLVEDEAWIRENLADVLRFESFYVLEATDGAEGLAMAEAYLPDLIISDVMMPEMTGYELFQALQQDLHTASIPFIFLTAYAEQSLREQGIALGVKHYLTKPFSVEELLTVIADIES